MPDSNIYGGGRLERRFDVRRRAVLRDALAVGLAVGGVPALASPTLGRRHGLVAYYPLDGTSGPVRDASGNGLRGKPLDNVTRGATGQVDAAFRFDGDDDGVEVPNDDGAFDLTSAWSIAAWVYPATSGSDYRNDPIVWKLARTGTNEDTFSLGWGGSGENRFRTGLERASDGTDFAVDSGTHPPGAWYHVVGVYDGETLRIHVDGSVEGRDDVGDVTAYTGRAPLRVGNLLHSTHGSSGVFDGRIDEVRVYSRPLSRGEVRVHERLGECGLAPSELPTAILDDLVAAGDAGNLRTVTDAVDGNVDVAAGSALFALANVNGNVDSGNGVVVLCGATVNGNVNVSDLVAVDARIAGNVQTAETVTAFGDVSVNGNLTGRTEALVVAPGSTLRVDGNVGVDRLVLGDDAALTVNGNLLCSSNDVAASAEVNVSGNDNCT